LGPITQVFGLVNAFIRLDVYHFVRCVSAGRFYSLVALADVDWWIEADLLARPALPLLFISIFFSLYGYTLSCCCAG
jgi:hypothetical protein